MKKVIVLLCICVAVISLSACSVKKVSNDSVTTKEITQTTSKNIQPTLIKTSSPLDDYIHITSIGFFTYNIKEVNTAKSMTIWFDKYVDGSYVESLPSLTTTLDHSSSALIYLSEKEDDDNLLTWTMNIKQGEKINSLTVTLEEKSKIGSGTVTLSKNAIIDQTIHLGYVVYDEDNRGVNVDENLVHNLNNNKVVYALNALFNS